ncbi:uncharacterized protein LOC113505340 isoform X3 [Trichoplusia ni]|uniref:Uncharacterized protein LOC113505340 isoform X3 n=1 Tax=Trichoplusia ni TaxID=7111 RepID=A0A7E5WU35_TRINI|nr:uncharacterized protein LOC113505340 isoform X3 [Trichoplusia ni]
MKCIVYIALVVLMGTVAVQGMAWRRYHWHRMDHDEPHYHGPHRFHHGQPHRFHHEHHHQKFHNTQCNGTSRGEGYHRRCIKVTSNEPPIATETSSIPVTKLILISTPTIQPSTTNRPSEIRPAEITTAVSSSTKKHASEIQSDVKSTTPSSSIKSHPTEYEPAEIVTTPYSTIHDTESESDLTSTPLYSSLATEASPAHFTSRPVRKVPSTPELTTMTLPQITTWRPKSPPAILTEMTPAPDTTISLDEGPPTLSPDIIRCIETCPATPEFNPVCGTNYVMYENEGKLFCAKSCGIDVSILRRSLCPPPVFEDSFEGGPPGADSPGAAPSEGEPPGRGPPGREQPEGGFPGRAPPDQGQPEERLPGREPPGQGQPIGGPPGQGLPEGGTPGRVPPGQGQPEGGPAGRNPPGQGRPEGGPNGRRPPGQGQSEGGPPGRGPPGQEQSERDPSRRGPPGQGQPEGGPNGKRPPGQEWSEGGPPGKVHHSQGQPEGGLPLRERPGEGQNERGPLGIGPSGQGQPEGGPPGIEPPGQGQPEGPSEASSSPPPTLPAFLTRTTPLSSFHMCMRQCPITADFTPVCGTDLITYMNMERLLCAQKCGDGVQVLCEKPCAVCGVNSVATLKPKATTSLTTTTASTRSFSQKDEADIRQCMRSCPVTPEYNPICGTDRLTYTNPGHLLCAQTCGVDVTVARFSPCHVTSTSTSTTEYPLTYDELNCIRDCRVTAVYNPVCGTDNLTYINLGHLECARYCGLDVALKESSRCRGDLDYPTESTEKTQAPTSPTIDREKDKLITTTQSTTLTTTSKPISTNTPVPTSSTTVGFTIPSYILKDIFETTTDNPVPLTTLSSTTTTTTTVRPTTEVDEDIDLDARFGKDIKDKDYNSRIIFPED